MLLSHDKTVLVVDDDEQILDLTSRILELAGYRVLTASDGFQALELLLHTPVPVHLMLIDLRMPGMDGAALADRVLRQAPSPQLLFMSGFAFPDPSDLLPGPLLSKPFSHEDLISQVRLLLQ